MKKIKSIVTAIATISLLASCSSDDDNRPEIVNEEEVITTLNITLTPKAGGTPITLQSRDLDGEGPNAPLISVSDNLEVGVTYNGIIELLNETVDPQEEVTEEIKEEDLDHQLFYTFGGGLDGTTTYNDFDSNGNPLGTEFTLIINSASSGTLNFVLRHLLEKPNTGLENAGGETELDTSFNITAK